MAQHICVVAGNARCAEDMLMFAPQADTYTRANPTCVAALTLKRACAKYSLKLSSLGQILLSCSYLNAVLTQQRVVSNAGAVLCAVFQKTAAYDDTHVDAACSKAPEL